jgi:cell division inhibitor SulA
MPTALQEILEHPAIWRGNQYARVAFESIPTGFKHLDAQLPGGGWPRAALTEILVDQQGIGEFSLLMPALTRLSQEKNWIALVAPPHIPYAPAWVNKGIDLSKVVVISTTTEQEKAWAAERCLRSSACSAVILWADEQTHRAYRRLQLAAETGKNWGVVFGPSHQARHASGAALRLKLESAQGQLKIHLIKCRGGGGLPELFIGEDHDAEFSVSQAGASIHSLDRLRQRVA